MISAGQMRSNSCQRVHEHVNLTILQLESTLRTHASATVADTVIRDSAVEPHSPMASRSRCL